MAEGSKLKNMNFFVPQAKKGQYETVYQAIIDTIKDQFGWKISERRIASLHYIHDKKEFRDQVGELEPHDNRYLVVAIFESNAYIVFTRTVNGSSGPTVLVDKAEVLGSTDFDPIPVRQN